MVTSHKRLNYVSSNKRKDVLQAKMRGPVKELMLEMVSSET